MKTEFHHDNWGVLVLWAHTCGHYSNSIRYDSIEDAEDRRTRMEAKPCRECLENALAKDAASSS